jgi:apolipoprotein N-acyltransferase
VATAAVLSRGAVPVAVGSLLRARPFAAAALGGLALALATPPVHFLPGLLSFAVLLHLLHAEPNPRRAFALGWTFGFAFCTAGLYWIAIAFFTDAERHGWLAVPAVLGLCALLASTIGVAAWAVALVRWRSLEARALAFAAAWVLAELARAGTIVQFPWNPVAIAWTATDATMQGVAWLGTYGLSLATVAAFGMAARWLEPGGGRARWAGLAPAAALSLVLLAGGAARLAGPEGTGLTPHGLRLVQANIPQELKWDRERRIAWFRRHLELSAGPAGAPPAAVIWPESAVPFQLETDPAAREYVASVLPPGGHALVGGDRFVFEGDDLVAASNSLFVLGADAAILARYDKVDLVPFGEFTPFRALLGQLGLGKVVQSVVDFSPGPGRVTIATPGLPPFSPLICYEAVFPNRAAPDGEPRPDWLLNVTNDAWFGRSSGPYQHLAMARMRAVEEGLPLVRAANTGISVVTDAKGRVLARLGLGEAGVVDARLPEPLPGGPSPARRLGWPLLAGLTLVLALLSVMVEIYARRHA